ncbi:MAG: (2Fe-2S)-binding protein [Sandaracinaceae bacterium]|nr:(2Fe-2S)-binding protein [Sandaracinaceae bacterium]
MAPRRLGTLAAPVTLRVDGDPVPAAPGEPVAVALAAAGRLVLGRSVKYHRPRGAACYRGRCEGCLMRVDGVASVTTCALPAEDGMVIETQNVVGSAERDLLALTDWFFPGGLKHHDMFTWSEAANKAMQKVARRVAGIGRLPDAVRELVEARTCEVDLLVIGGGPAGLAAAAHAARAGLDVALVDEALALGGSLAWWPLDPLEAAEPWIEAARAAGARLSARTAALAAYDPWEDVAGAAGPAPAARTERLVVVTGGPDGLERVRPARTLVATGRHVGASAFGDADTPGVVDLHGACVLLSHGVLPGARVAVAGEGRLAGALAQALAREGAEVLGPYPEAALVEADGRPALDAIIVRTAEGERKLRCDALAVLPPSSAVYELAAQAGVAVRFSGTGYELEVGAAGATAAPDVRVTGWAAGPEERSLDAVRAEAEAAAAAIVEELR